MNLPYVCTMVSSYIDALFLDFTKSFLTRYHMHERLCYKLSYFGTNEPLLSWIKDFLSVRTQKVVLYPALSGVPQCIVLSLLLFLLYIKNMTYFCYKSNEQFTTALLETVTVLLECMGYYASSVNLTAFLKLVKPPENRP